MSANLQLGPSLPAELVARAARERDFFNHKNRHLELPEHVLRIPDYMHEIPPEVHSRLPNLLGKDVCEVGCGYGVISCYFAARGACVLGIDVADSNIAVAKTAARVNGVGERTRFQVMQAEALGVPKHSFDLIYGNAVLHHLDIRASAKEFLRVLRPGGVAIFREPLGENQWLEWARRSPLRSARNRHTADERSLLYRDVETLRSVFPDVHLRESELFTVLRAVFRKIDVGMVTVPRWRPLMDSLGAIDSWLLSRYSGLRPLASYCVVMMVKSTNQLT